MHRLQDLNCVAGRADQSAPALVAYPVILDNQELNANTNLRVRLKEAREMVAIATSCA